MFRCLSSIQTNKGTNTLTKIFTIFKIERYTNTQTLKIAQSVSGEGGVAQQTLLPNTKSKLLWPGINISNNRGVPITSKLNLDILVPCDMKGTLEQTDQP